MRYHPFSHFGLKVVALALATLFWMMVSAQVSSVDRGLRIPLELQNLPSNLEMVDPPQHFLPLLDVIVECFVRQVADLIEIGTDDE